MDGIYGPETAQNISKFQEQTGLPVTGLWTPREQVEYEMAVGEQQSKSALRKMVEKSVGLDQFVQPDALKVEAPIITEEAPVTEKDKFEQTFNRGAFEKDTFTAIDLRFSKISVKSSFTPGIVENS